MKEGISRLLAKIPVLNRIPRGSRFLRVFLFVFLVLCFFCTLNFLFPLRTEKDYSQLVLSADGTVIHAFLTRDEKWRMFTELDEITPQLKKAILAKEDKYFYFHYGINPGAVLRAAFNNTVKHRKTSGASTITMQVARLLYPNKRTYFNKAVEMFRALQLEWKYSKDEILQLYLNLVPYGSNIEGVKSASILYFGKTPNYLNISQIATLAIIPNRPTSLKLGQNNREIEIERNRWLRLFEKDKIFTREEVKDASAEALAVTRLDAPRYAPHFSYRLKKMFPGQPIIRSNLNLQKQVKVQNLVSNYARRLNVYNIFNASVIVVNNRTRCVEAYVGSQDFYDTEHFGQVDGVKAVRSPGSTLKPLIYGLAFDRGLLTPKKVITDVPTDFRGYSPENFDDQFNGNVTVERALAFSLNIPAVKTLDMLGVPTLLDKLKEADFAQIRKDEPKLGLSVALGGCGVRLEEMVNLYSTFANEGSFKPLKWTKQDSTVHGKQLLSQASAFLLSTILTQLTRPDLPNNYESSIHVPKIAWKTGTSYGRRDAWSIGYNKNYTIGVWVGNFSGTGVPELTGADMATPLLFDIFNTLNYNASNEWFLPQGKVKYRWVCPESGNEPGELCRNQVLDYYIPGVSGTEKCRHLKTVFVSADEDMSYCTSCVPRAGYKKKVYQNYDAELISYMESENMVFEKIPKHNPDCQRIFSDKPPVIRSPANGKEFLLEKNDKQELLLDCSTDNEVKTVYWYINDRFYKKAAPREKVFFRPQEGQVKVSCSDDKGRNVNSWVVVKFY